jgi:hypothetical protein
VLVPLDAATDAPHVHYTTTFTGAPEETDNLKAALAKGKTVDVDVQASLGAGEEKWDALEDYLGKATDGTTGNVILCESTDICFIVVLAAFHPVHFLSPAHVSSPYIC